MKVITANRLSDGVVVYLSDKAELVEEFEAARLFGDDETASALEEVLRRKTTVAQAYEIAADAAGPAGREALRENIRRNGPTVRPDLGKRADDTRDL